MAVAVAVAVAAAAATAAAATAAALGLFGFWPCLYWYGLGWPVGVLGSGPN